MSDEAERERARVTVKKSVFLFTRISFFSFGLLSKNDPNKDAHFQASAFGSLVAAPQHGWAADFRFMAHWGAHPSVDRLSRTTRAPSAARPPAAGPADAAKFRSAQAALGLSCTRGPVIRPSEFQAEMGKS